MTILSSYLADGYSGATGPTGNLVLRWGEAQA